MFEGHRAQSCFFDDSSLHIRRRRPVQLNSQRSLVFATLSWMLLISETSRWPAVCGHTRSGGFSFVRLNLPSWGFAHPEVVWLAGSGRAALRAVTGQQDRGTGKASKRVTRIGLLVDGDQFGPKSWEPAADAVRKHGELVRAIVFASPRESVHKRTNAKWADALRKIGAVHYPVTRPQSSSKDPNDIAMGFAAGFLVGRRAVDAMALLTRDGDFGFLVRQINSCGCRCFWLWPESDQLPGANQWPAYLDAAGAERLLYKPVLASRQYPLPKFCNELLPDGSSIIRELPSEEASRLLGMRVLRSDCAPVLMPLLTDLGYVKHSGQSWLPAFAKMCAASGVTLRVFPEPASCACQLFQSVPRLRWKRNPGNLIFIRPQGPQRGASCISNVQQERYGNGECMGMVMGGGAFILEDGDNVVRRILERLGFLDDDLNADLHEAIEVFCSRTLNRRNLRIMGIAPAVPELLSEKEELLWSAFTSPDQPWQGHWGTATSDKQVRTHLAKKGLVKSEACSSEELFACLRDEARKHGRPVRVTYNAYVHDFLMQVNAKDPSRLTSA